MKLVRTVPVAAAAVGVALLTGVGPASADSCTVTAYSDNCVTTPTTPVGSTTEVQGTRFTSPSSLPFTGGDVALLSSIGGLVLAGGLALTVAGRRRSAE